MNQTTFRRVAFVFKSVHEHMFILFPVVSPLTSSDVNGTESLNVLSASTESLVFLWETDSSSLPFLLRDLANTNDLSLHVPINSVFAAAFRSLSANRLDLFLQCPAQGIIWQDSLERSNSQETGTSSQFPENAERTTLHADFLERSPTERYSLVHLFSNRTETFVDTTVSICSATNRLSLLFPLTSTLK